MGLSDEARSQLSGIKVAYGGNFSVSNYRCILFGLTNVEY